MTAGEVARARRIRLDLDAAGCDCAARVTGPDEDGCHATLHTRECALERAVLLWPALEVDGDRMYLTVPWDDPRGAS